MGKIWRNKTAPSFQGLPQCNGDSCHPLSPWSPCSDVWYMGWVTLGPERSFRVTFWDLSGLKALQENGRHGMKKTSTGQVRGTNVLSGSEAQSQWEGAVLPGLVWISPLLRASQAGGGQSASECPSHGTHDYTHPGREGRPWSHPALLPPVGRALSSSISTSKSSTTAPLRNHQRTM